MGRTIVIWCINNFQLSGRWRRPTHFVKTCITDSHLKSKLITVNKIYIYTFPQVSRYKKINTSFSIPNLGKVDVLELHCWQNTWPHARQWWRRTINENATRHLKFKEINHKNARCVYFAILRGCILIIYWKYVYIPPSYYIHYLGIV